MTTEVSLVGVYEAGERLLARQVLTDFVTARAKDTAEQVGFSWHPATDAPSTFADVQAAYERSQRLGLPLPVSSEHDDGTIYLDAAANQAFRFWHDVSHVRLGLSFELVDELELALRHLAALEDEGFARDTVPYRMLHADSVGQAQLMALVRRFPSDQARFVAGCLGAGYDHGLLAEAHRSG